MISAGGEGKKDGGIAERQEGQETHRNFGQNSKVTDRLTTDQFSFTAVHPQKGG